MSLFEQLPEHIFRPLAAGNRRFYAALLLHLHEHTFAAAGDAPRRQSVIAEIGDFTDAYSKAHGPIEKEEMVLSAQDIRSLKREAAGQDVLRYNHFRYLVNSGWLIEIRDRLRKLVDLSPEGRLLLREFQKIVSGDTRSYGGAVLNVLAQLEQAKEHPEERSECIFNAWTFSRDFSHHLRTIAASMRQVEDRVLSQHGHRAVFRAFFDEFVSKVLIADYKTLKTRNNPFRFRHKILERAKEIEADQLILNRLAAGYVREGRGNSAEEAESRLRREIDEIYALFDTIDGQLDVIGETQIHMERKISTIVRYMDRHDGGAVDRATRAMRSLGSIALPDDGDVMMEPRILLMEPLLGGDLLYAPREYKRAIERSRIRASQPDPVREAFHQAKLDYARRLSISPQRLRDFIVRALDIRDPILGSEIPIETVDEFIVFQRLRDVPFIFDGLLKKQFAITPIGARAANQWLEYSDFRLSRVNPGDR